ncbi:MAG: hypothetical protein U0936_21635 [Planctomycetaceae bacterium]
MILRDVGLATYTLSRGRRDDECVDFRRFEFEVECICDLYIRCLPKLVTAETAKVVFDVIDEDGWVTPSRIERRLSVTVSPWRASLTEYWRRDELGRKQFAIETLHGGLMWLSGIEGWPVEPFIAAYEGCQQRGLVNEFFCKKTFPGPSRNVTIKLFCEFGPHEAKLFAVVMRRRKEIARIYLGYAKPCSTLIWTAVQSFSWLNDHAVQITDSYFCGERLYDLTSVLEQTS